MTPFDVIIPARFGSVRLPGKPLLDVCGKTLIHRVYDCATNSRANRVIVATDDRRIHEAVKEFGGEVCMTKVSHSSGTDRIAEVVTKLDVPDEHVVVNLQGDEPEMPGELINQVADCLALDENADMATACADIVNKEDIDDESVVKVVMDRNGHALYFSRASVPWFRKDRKNNLPVTIYRRHIGIYAYRAGYIKEFSAKQACDLEKTERLEQLRALWWGGRIAVCQAVVLPGEGIDTQNDLDKIRAKLSKKSD